MNAKQNDLVDVNIDNICFQLQEEHNFLWLRKMGNVFCVFDQQGSGNIGFGVEKNGEKFFIKYAGAKPVNFSGHPIDAIEHLKEAIPVYKELEHPDLIQLIDHFAIEKGYVTVFHWFEGDNLYPHREYSGPAKSTNPKSPFYHFRNLDIEKRLKSLDTIFSFHEHVESKGYVAIDFYDGNILYDFEKDETKICDIDFYRKSPTINHIGEDFWGSKRFKSPEEYQLGSPIDSKTNVYNMGSIAFGLVGGGLDHSLSNWEANEDLYKIALKAVDKNRDNRYASIKAFYEAWKKALVRIIV